MLFEIFLAIIIWILLLIEAFFKRGYEFLVLYLFAILGLSCIIRSNDFLFLYLSIELFSLPMYGLIAYRGKQSAVNASIQYFLMGILSSCLLLYGVSLLYGLTGNFNFVIANIGPDKMAILQISFILILSGLFFKLGIVPFHSWLVDVYAAAPVSVVMLLTFAPKIAIVIVLAKILFVVYGIANIAWQHVIVSFGLFSLLFGNIMAILQDNLKRMLGYSAIANIGFAVLGLVLGENGVIISCVYILVYGVLYIAAFAFSYFCSFDLNKLSELWNNAKGASVLLLIILASIVGLPPFPGFIAKFWLLQELFRQEFVLSAVLAGLFSILGVGYFVRVVRELNFS